MKLIIFILTTILIYSCVDKKPYEKKIELYYLINSDRSNTPDTIKYSDLNSIDTADKFIAQEYFFYNKKEHNIKAFTSDNHANTDGGVFYYTLDSIGIIYSRSTTWWTYISLKSNNDSINNLVTQALEQILLRPKLHCYQCGQLFEEEIKFIPPELKTNK